MQQQADGFKAGARTPVLAEVAKLIGTPESLQYILQKVEKFVAEMYSIKSSSSAGSG